MQLSANAFKSVIDIDVLGSYNTLKATLPHLLKSAATSKADGHDGVFWTIIRAALVLSFSQLIRAIPR